ncbi:MAG: DegT/DnrJ/EryC1/StrS family aminotransferase, partial [Anaerolineales bacterium]|nr:DegT/DnrJ/EryC1/StrS family aminotransferase [Anaerolineales bacterium]
GRPELAEKLRLLRSHGMTSLTWDRHNGHAYSYDVVELGHNDRIDELRAALGRVQLAKLERNNARRGLITSQYWQALASTPLELPFRASVLAQARLTSSRAYRPAYHIFPLLLPVGLERAGFVERLKAAGVQTSLHYPPIHTFSYYRKHMPRVSLPRTEVAAAREVTLPLFPTMRRDQVEQVVEAVLAATAETAW